MLASASTGLMNSVLEKLAGLMVDESTKHVVGVHKQLRFLHHELSSMRGALEDVADTDEDLSSETKAWRNQVTELAYDTEDCIDDFRYCVEDPPHDGQGQGFVRRAAHLLETLMARYKISRKIKELRTRVQEASDRHTRYRLDECVSRSAHVAVDPRITALYAETSSLVGIDAPKEDVIKLLTEVDDASLQELRVVSIVGFGGLGKTTLANEVYRNLGGSFCCKAIMSVSQRPDMISLLKSLFSKVSGQGADHIYDLQGLIDNLREYLQGKRMKPLDDYHSRQLFLGRVFGPGGTCPEPFQGLHEKILQKCGGLPLAIITIASLLASQPTKSVEQWRFVLDSLRHNLGLDPTLEGMRRILNLSYTHLPHPLKACLLYIGMYPEDYEIQRDDLAIHCVAEGFVSGVADGREAVEVAGSYLNELVNRSMILQRVKQVARGECITYRVHDMVLDLILSKSTEENFLCAVQNLQAQQQCKARRLSLQVLGRSLLVDSGARVCVPHVRSLIIFGWPLRSLELLELKFIRVLIIEHANDLDLNLISKLFHLRHLCVRGGYGARLQLPEELSGLQRLEAMVIVSGLCGVPRDIVSLPALFYLHFPLIASYPDGIGNMKSLHTLRNFDPSKQSVANIRALGELLNLRVLDMLIGDVTFATKGTHMDALWSSLEKLISCNLRALSMLARDNVGRDSKWSSLRFSCSHLEQLHLYFRSTRMPGWVCQLRALSSFRIKVWELCRDDVAVLAGLPVLARLVLDAEIVPAEGVVFSADAAFRVLGSLRIPYVAEAGITFEAGSVPQVETLSFLLLASDVKRHGVKLAGIEHLPNFVSSRCSSSYYAATVTSLRCQG